MHTLHAEKADTLKKSFFGLMGQKTIESLFLSTRFGIHTFFVKRPIDILILNKDNRVVKIKKSLKPNNVFFWNPRYNKVLELPRGTISAYEIKEGNKVRVILT